MGMKSDKKLFWKHIRKILFVFLILNNIITNKRGGKMGKGDRKSKKGKIWRGTNGKRRPKSSVLKKAKKKLMQKK